MTVIRIGAEPEPFSARGLFFDGDTAVGDLARLSIDETAQTLVIARVGFPALHWPLADIRALPDQAAQDQMALRLRDDMTARLLLNDLVLMARLPNAHKRAPVTRRGRLVGWAVAAVASVALIILVLVPLMADQLAEYIPPEGERALGRTTLEQIRAAMDESGLDRPVPFCEGAEGVAALQTMQDKLTIRIPNAPDLSVYVLDQEMLNAFALPGGYIVFFRGLIEAAETPEEVAAVFAHEIGHVVSRDPTRHALRSAGSIGVLGLLFGDFAGGAMVLFLTERLIQASYSREAEAAADAFGHDLMLRAGINPSALGVFFQRLKDLYGEDDSFFAHFASHPALSDRILSVQRHSHEGFIEVPVLSDAEWAALQKICD